MRRDRTTPPTPSSVRGLATRRGYLFAADQRSTRMFKLISLLGLAAPLRSQDGKQPYSWKRADADAWLTKQPLLSDRSSAPAPGPSVGDREHAQISPAAPEALGGWRASALHGGAASFGAGLGDLAGAGSTIPLP